MKLFNTRRLPRQQPPPSGPPLLLSTQLANIVLGCCEALLNLRIVLLRADGTSEEADVKLSEMGCVITLPLTGTGDGTGTTAAGVTQFKIVSDGGDYWVCKEWDGTTLASTTTNVYKPFKLRAGGGGPSSEAIRGTTYSYTYVAVTVGSVTGYYKREVRVGGTLQETDYMIPDPLANDIIYAMPVANSTSIDWLDINADARAWSK